jgi:hypothetical protein
VSPDHGIHHTFSDQCAQANQTAAAALQLVQSMTWCGFPAVLMPAVPIPFSQPNFFTNSSDQNTLDLLSTKEKNTKQEDKEIPSKSIDEEVQASATVRQTMLRNNITNY